MSAPLVLAVPSKGRLEEKARAFFARAGLKLTRGRGARDYRGAIEGVSGAEVAFLSAAEIARDIASGAVHLGVTGEDLIHETIADTATKVEVLTGLGFGETSVVVAVPQSWIDVTTMEDLDDVAHEFRSRHGRRLRVATKYVNLTQRFFASAGIADYRIVESLGATEGAPAAGSAEIIVDITTTGATLAANGLKVLEDGIILKSEACLAASLTARWDDDARSALAQVLDLVAAESRAREVRQVRVDMPKGSKIELESVLAGQADVSVISKTDGGILLQVPADAAQVLAERFKSAGAQRVAVARQSYVFEAKNELLERMLARLDTGPAS
ncbi:MAG: ATP phosphoribosyltransferase [Rhizobiales bacterium]|nr:ATP phosphoribosyltransferase [Hyphomicrobiales bacterium]